MKNRFEKLLTIKSIVTICLLGAVIASVFSGLLNAEILDKSFLLIIGFYFGTQKIKEEI